MCHETRGNRDCGEREAVIACGSPKLVDGDLQQTACRHHQDDDGDEHGEVRRVFRCKGNGRIHQGKAGEGVEASPEAGGEVFKHVVNHFDGVYSEKSEQSLVSSGSLVPSSASASRAFNRSCISVNMCDY